MLKWAAVEVLDDTTSRREKTSTAGISGLAPVRFGAVSRNEAQSVTISHLHHTNT